jgi:hypothetical protein
MNCNCIEEVNKKLYEQNLRLSGYAFIMPTFKPVFTITTEWIDPDKAPKGRKNRPMSMFVSHCPFCGKPVE